MRILCSLILISFLSACASSQFGEYAVYENGSSPLKVSARYSQGMCSDYFGYIDVAVENPSSQWLSMKNVRLGFDGNNDGTSHFQLVAGEQLAAWADARQRLNGREDYNASMAMLAVVALGNIAVRSSNENLKKAGAVALVGADLINTKDSIVRAHDAASYAPTTESTHFMAGNVKIPPGMDRAFWLLLSADNDAQVPLLGGLHVIYENEQGQDVVMYLPVSDVNKCDWQQNRKDYLKQTAAKRGIAPNAAPSSQTNKRLMTDYWYLEKSLTKDGNKFGMNP